MKDKRLKSKIVGAAKRPSLSHLPLNRDEKFYTATVLPALLFHRGLKNFYRFLGLIDGLPTDIRESTTGYEFLYSSEYDLLKSVGKPPGANIKKGTKGTKPDVVIQILKPQSAMVVIEAKMFTARNRVRSEVLKEVSGQMRLFDFVREELKIAKERAHHVVLLPRTLARKVGRVQCQVIEWDVFLEDTEFDIRDNYFFEFLKAALENYDEFAEDPRRMPGSVLYQKAREGEIRSVGRGRDRIPRELIAEDIKNGVWEETEYRYDNTRWWPPPNYISGTEFVEMVRTLSDI